MQALAALTPMSATQVSSSGQSWIKSLFTSGISIGWIGLFLLAGGIPIAPLSFWGYGGLNLMAVGATGWAAAKAASQAGSIFLSSTIETYYPKFWPYAWLFKYSPWYIFDLIQLFNPNFAQEGFRIPFVNRQIGTKGGSGSLTALVIMSAVGLFSLGGYALLDYIPPEITRSAAPILKIVFMVVGGLTALVGGSLGAVFALPQILSAIRSETKTASTEFAAGASQPIAKPSAPAKGGSITIPETAHDPLEAPGIQAGGAGGAGALSAMQTGQMGSQMPRLDIIAKGLLGPSPSGDPAPYPTSMPKSMTGGGKKSKEDPEVPLAFMGILGILVFGGAALALVRSKQM